MSALLISRSLYCKCSEALHCHGCAAFAAIANSVNLEGYKSAQDRGCDKRVLWIANLHIQRKSGF